MVAVRVASRMVLHNRRIAFHLRRPKAIRQNTSSRGAWSIIAIVKKTAEHRIEPHDMEVRPIHNARLHDARFAKPDHREPNGRELANLAQRCYSRPEILNLRH